VSRAISSVTAALVAAVVVAVAVTAGAAGAARSDAADAPLAYVVTDGGMPIAIERVGPDGQGRTRLGRGGQISWSPDGTRIAFVDSGADGQDVHVMATDGGVRRQLTSDPGDEFHPAWSPDGRLLAFGHTPRWTPWSGDAALLVLDTATGRRWTVAEDLVPGEAPSWSPDGRELVYAAWRDAPGFGHLRGTDLVAVAADGTASRQLTHTESTPAGPTLERSPRWSPDGAWIAFVRRPFDSNHDADLWLVRPDGSSERRVAERVQPEGQFGWSPDGRSIAYVDRAILVAGVDGRSPRRLTGTSGERAPVWSADGSKIAFLRQLQNTGGFELYVMNADGSCETRLTAVSRSSRGPHVVQAAWQPAVSSGPRIECVDVGLSDDGPASRPGTEPTATDGVLMGSRVRYRVVVESSGTRRATRVTLRLARTRLLVPTSARGRGARCRTRPAVVCELGTLAPGATRTVLFDAVVSSAAVERVLRGRDYLTLVADDLWFSVSAREREPNSFDNVLHFRQHVWSCSLRGTAGADRLRGTPGRDRICGAQGDDVIHALAGDDVVHGGVGSDLIVPGRGRDRVRGGPGDDTILAADGERDTIHCGPGRDRALADRIDVVARDCERVERR
jgi:Tol biopolymer transport system component